MFSLFFSETTRIVSVSSQLTLLSEYVSFIKISLGLLRLNIVGFGHGYRFFCTMDFFILSPNSGKGNSSLNADSVL